MTTFHRISTRCLLAAATLIGIVATAHAQAREAGRPGVGGGDVRGIVKSVDAKTGTITLAFGGGREAAPTEKTFSLAKNVEVCVPAGGGFRAGGVFKEIKLADIAEGSTVGLVMAGDQVDAIIADEPIAKGVLKSFDAKKGTLTVNLGPTGGGRGEAPVDVEKTYTITADTEIAIDDGRGRRHSIREAKLEDLSEGAIVSLRLSLDKKTVSSILAEGSTVTGIVKEVVPAKRAMTIIVRPARGDDAGEERIVAIAKDALILVDDGKGRRLSLKEGKLTDVPVGSSVVARLAGDQSFVMTLKAEGPQLLGILKAIDAEKGAITIGIPKNREEFDEKTYILAKDGKVNIDGKAAKLADLKVEENGPFIQLRLALDQRTAQAVIVSQGRR